MALKTQFPFEDVTYGITASALPGERITQPKSIADSIPCRQKGENIDNSK
jgi:hypothetical protein